MKGLIRTRLAQGHRTMRYPDGPPPELPPRFRGRPLLEAGRCPAGCRDCTGACPTGGLTADPESGRLALDTGRCLFCSECSSACTAGAIRLGTDHRLAARRREDLVVTPAGGAPPEVLDDRIRRRFGRSLKLRQVSAGGCNACEADTNVLNTLAWDLGRFGIQFVAGPRHADGLLVTGPVSRQMADALRRTWEAVPEPKIVIAVGACAISGGLYADHPETCGGVDTQIPVDLYVPGCPPHPLTLLDGLLRLLGRLA
ncbi:MAG: NADH-quinone oxidoreductase subunit NuoB [Candidatus Latescibacterota bacterium]